MIIVLLAVIYAMMGKFNHCLETAIPLIIQNSTCYVLDMEKQLGTSTASIYPVLMRLEMQGIIKSTAEPTGRRAYTFVALQDRVPNDVYLPSLSRQS